MTPRIVTVSWVGPNHTRGREHVAAKGLRGTLCGLSVPQVARATADPKITEVCFYCLNKLKKGVER